MQSSLTCAYTKRRKLKFPPLLFLAVFLFSFPLLSWPDVAISEIFYDPLGVDTGKEWVELTNRGAGSIDLSDYELNAVSAEYYTFPSYSLGAGESTVIHWNADGANSAFDLYTGSSGFSNMGNSNGWAALFSSYTHNSGTIRYYLEYGSLANTWESAAISVGLWQSGTYALGAPAGSSLELKAGALGDKGQDYFIQSLPNPGIHPSTLPIPEPASILLFLGGLLGLAWRRSLH